MNINLRHIKAFVVIIETGSFSAAAEKLCVVPSALTSTIHQLEQECGLKLLERTTRKIELTDMGKIFLPVARNLVKEFASALNDIQAYTTLSTGKVSIAAFASVISESLPQHLKEYRSKYPGIHISIRDEGADQILNLVREKKVDIGITSLKQDCEEDLQTIKYCSDLFGILCRTDHPLLSKKSTVSWSDIKPYPYIRLSKDTGINSLLSSELDRIIMPPASTLEVSSITALQALIAAGFGISVLPRLAASTHKNPLLAFIEPKGATVSRTIYIVYQKNRNLSPAALMFIEMLKAPDASFATLHTEENTRDS